MGDGTVALILDVIGIAQQSHVLTEHARRQLIDANKKEADQHSRMESYLVVAPDNDSRAAIPLSTVSRLEEIQVSDIENVGHQQVVQYRGQIMPLVPLSQYGHSGSEDGAISLVVYNNQGRNIGIIVGRIIDIINDACSDSPGESRIIAGRVTRIVDLAQLTCGY